MTLNDLIDLVALQPGVLAGLWLLVPVLAGLLGWIHGPGRGGTSPWRHAHAVLVYAACVPGVSSTVLTLYTVLFLHTSLLEVPFLIYLAPIASMVATLVLQARVVDFDAIPGFDRLAGLMTLIAITFGLLLALDRAHIWLAFHAPMVLLLTIGAAIFGALRWATRAIARPSSDPAEKPPWSRLTGE